MKTGSMDCVCVAYISLSHPHSPSGADSAPSQVLAGASQGHTPSCGGVPPLQCDLGCVQQSEGCAAGSREGSWEDEARRVYSSLHRGCK